MHIRDRQSGFTLIEVLVAMMVLSVSIVVMMQLLSANVKSLPANEAYARAVSSARLQMEKLLLSPALSVGERTGRFDEQMSWTATVSLYEDPEEKEPPDREKNEKKERSPLIRINLEIHWEMDGKKKSYALSTLKCLPDK